MKSIDSSIKIKNLFLIIISLSFINSWTSKSDDEILKENYINEINFESVLNQNSVQFHEYENPKSLMDDFFGFDDPLNEYQYITNFQDLSLQIDSRNVRELYKEKLLEMSNKIKKNEEDIFNQSFFNKKI